MYTHCILHNIFGVVVIVDFKMELFAVSSIGNSFEKYAKINMSMRYNGKNLRKNNNGTTCTARTHACNAATFRTISVAAHHIHHQNNSMAKRVQRNNGKIQITIIL